MQGLLTAVLATVAVSLAATLCVVLPLSIRGRARLAYRLCVAAAGLCAAAGTAAFLTSQFESYPIAAAKLSLAAMWILLMGFGPALAGRFLAWRAGGR